MSLIVDSVKYISLSDNVPIDDISFVRNNNNYFIFNKAHKKAYKLSGDTLDLLKNYDKTYNKIYGNVKTSQNLVHQPFQPSVNQEQNNKDIIPQIVDNLFNGFMQHLKQIKLDILLAPQKVFDEFYRNNIKNEVQKIVKNTDADTYLSKNETLLRLLCKDKFDEERTLKVTKDSKPIKNERKVFMD